MTSHVITFEEFVKYVIETLKRGMPDPHWASFSATCLPCLVNYDFIGKLETSSEDFAYVMKRYANATSFPANLHGPTSRDHKKTTNQVFKKYYNQLPPELLRHLVQSYRTDFDLFGYNRHQPLKEWFRIYYIWHKCTKVWTLVAGPIGLCCYVFNLWC